MTTKTETTGLKAQRSYVQELHSSEFDFSVVVAEAFVRGIRDIGYRNTGTAIDELIDNGIQAGAEAVHVAFGYTGSSEKKPTAFAVFDDGHGMDPEMIRLSMIWGGTHRANDRSGFGRYGFGLPSASMSQGQRFTVFSRTGADEEFSAVSFDLRELADGKYSVDGRVVIPEPSKKKLPRWAVAYAEEHFDGGDSLRTAVVVEELDGLTWKTETGLMKHLLPHFGITYRNLLRSTNIVVQGRKIDPIDPLFLTEGARMFDLDDDRVEPRPPTVISVRGEKGGEPSQIRVRYSLAPYGFQRDKVTGKLNERFNVMKEHNGIIVLRNGRQMDVVWKTPWVTFGNNDRNVGIEIDFPAELDEEFSVTTSKQQVVLSDRIWDLLDKNGVRAALRELRTTDAEHRAASKAAEAEENRKKAAEQVMEAAEKFKTKKPEASPEKVQKAQDNFKAEVDRRAKESGLPAEEIAARVEAEAKDRPFLIEERSAPGAPFYRAEQRGGQRVIIINTAHAFYTDVYAGPESTIRLRAAIELLLFVLGDAELDAVGERQLFYSNEREVWSSRLATTLAMLRDYVDEDDTGEAEESTAEVAAIAG